MRCPGCGRELDADARFCKRCGRAIGTQEPAAESSGRDSARERKIATLLFADIVGFTSIGEGHDPEVVASLVADAFERLAHEVRRYEGTVEKFAGDAMLAVFGVPVAHEDDSERAVRAAIGMQSAMGSMRATSDDDRPELELRVGIDTGEVLVDRARVSSERDLFVTGDAVNTAARLETAAEPGAILVGDATYRASTDVVAYEAMPALKLKGKAGPVVAWRAVAIRAAGVGRRARLGQESPLVGRDDELSRLKDAVRQVAEDGRPHLVTILGSAGVGKSRLARELERYLDDRPEMFHWRVGRCVAYADRSYGPVADVVKADTGISDDDGPGAAREKLARRLQALRLGDEERLRRALQAVLGIGDGIERPRADLFEAWGRYLSAIAERAPLVFVMEDIHWAADDVLAFLDYLARWGEGRIAILCLARHELLEHVASWGHGVPSATTIALEPLDAVASAALMDALLDGSLPLNLQARIIERTEGNPLFAEETVRMLVDRDVLRLSDGAWQLSRPLEEIEVPASVHAVLAARLDTLPAAEKSVLQHASVAGRVFWDALVAHVQGVDLSAVEKQLHHLRAKDLVVLREPSSLVGAAELGFRHVLIRDVVYESLPKRDRAVIHDRIATWVEERMADRIDEFAELVASHLATSLGYQETLTRGGSGELHRARERAYQAAQRAARRASSLGVSERACRWLRAAIDLAYALERSPREVARLADDDATIHGATARYPDHLDMLARLVGELERLTGLTEEDEQLIARLRSALAGAYVGAGDNEGGRQIAHDGIARLEDGEPTPGRARLHRTLGWACWHGGSTAEAAAPLETALAEALACGDEQTERWAQQDLGIVSVSSNLDAAIGLLERSYRLALDVDDRALLFRCRSNLTQLRFQRGDPLASVLDLSEECLHQVRLETEGRSHHLTAWFHAYYLWEAGSLDEALAVADEALEAAVANGGSHGAHYGLRAMVRRSRGEIAAAERDDAAIERDDAGPIIDHEWSETMLERTWATWTRDPGRAAANLEARLGGTDLHPVSKAETVPTFARMALRLGDRAQLERAISAYRRFEQDPPIRKLRLSMDGLAAADEGTTLEEHAVTLEGDGYNLTALDLWMDAALVAARAGRLTDATSRARAIIDRTGFHPLIGPLPETRWLEAPP